MFCDSVSYFLSDVKINPKTVKPHYLLHPVREFSIFHDVSSQCENPEYFFFLILNSYLPL